VGYFVVSKFTKFTSFFFQVLNFGSIFFLKNELQIDVRIVEQIVVVDGVDDVVEERPFLCT